jgi:hypothetical protein
MEVRGEMQRERERERDGTEPDNAFPHQSDGNPNYIGRFKGLTNEFSWLLRQSPSSTFCAVASHDMTQL